MHLFDLFTRLFMEVGHRPALPQGEHVGIMKERVKNRIRHSVLVFVLLGAVAESLPQLHHHQEAHACTQIDGTFFYIESVDNPLRTEHGTQAVGLRHGEEHEHETCGLCHLVPYSFPDMGESSLARSGKTDYPHPFISQNNDKQIDLHEPRGPPDCSDRSI